MSEISDLKSKIKTLENDYETNVKNKCSTGYYTSEICETDSKVRQKIISFYDICLDEFNKMLSTASEKAAEYNYDETLENISSIKTGVSRLISACNQLNWEINQEGVKAYNRVKESFDDGDIKYKSNIQSANSRLSTAEYYYDKYKKSMVDSIGSGDLTSRRYYKDALRKASNSYGMASTQYKALIELIEFHGLKKTETASVEAVAGESNNNETPVESPISNDAIAPAISLETILQINGFELPEDNEVKTNM